MSENFLERLGAGIQQAGQGFIPASERASTDQSKALAGLYSQRADFERQEAQASMMEMRRQAFIQDAQVARTLVEQGRPDLAQGLLQQRIQVGSQLGLDMSDTEMGLQMLESGDTESFMQTTGAVLSQWQQRQAAAQEQGGRVLTGAQVKEMYGVDVDPNDLYNLKPDGTLSREVAAGGGEQEMTAYQKEQLRLREAQQALDIKQMEADGRSLPPKLLDYQLEQDRIVQTAAASATQAKQLAEQYELYKPASGVGAEFDEFIKEFTGEEDAVSQIRARYKKLRNEIVVQNLPPGIASDIDIQIAMEPFPKATSSTKFVSGFLRGMAKMETFKAAQAMYNRDYLTHNRNIDNKERFWKAPVAFKRVGPDGKEVTKKTSLAEIYWAAAETGMPVPEAMRILGITDGRILSVVGYGNE